MEDKYVKKKMKKIIKKDKFISSWRKYSNLYLIFFAGGIMVYRFQVYSYGGNYYCI